ncbi:leucine-rich repeat domain-containing protein [Polyangium sp. 15x6]|uniref:leucine-rich repeat domain-containing protein n=1 Tax=Polyangium sp. 15x6 TaxID=3042687 RepID=UPI00249B4E1D|nr:leucine-rich repeat domain-containing protein [Polyangium sp. 15x6]MDI3285879.1 leucine-rich repeat domain-containing protein [Polyangium sp. 15x6]
MLPRTIAPLAGIALSIALTSLVGCDEKKPDAAPTKPSAAPVASAAPTPTPTPTPSAAEPAPPPKKKDVVCSKDATITFTNQAFEDAVRSQAQKKEGALTRADLGKVKTLKLTEAKLEELDPCIFPLFTSVKGVYLPPGKIEDLSPLKTLTTIESLRIAATQVKDLTPLAGLAKLDRLDIGRTPVKDLTPLSGLTNLTELQIDETEVTDLTPLSKLKKLEMLQMKRTRITDLSPLKELKSLKSLHIGGSAVSGQAVMLGIPGLKVNDE